MMERKRENSTNVSPDSQYQSFWKKFEQDAAGEYDVKWQPEMRKGYIEQGAEFVVDIHEREVNMIFFMDKSARPLALFFLALWKRIFPRENPPQMRFFIGEFGKYLWTEDLRDYVKKSEGLTDEQVDNEINVTENARIEKIRQTYHQNDFKDKIVLVVDEYGNKGSTLQTAKERFTQAFPDIKQVLVGTMDWQYDSTYKAPISLDVAPPADSSHNPCYYSSRKKKLGRTLLHQVDYVIEGANPNHELNDAPVIVDRNPGIKPTETIGYNLLQIGKFEHLDQQSIMAANQAERYCIEHNDKIGITRAQKIKQAYSALATTAA